MNNYIANIKENMEKTINNLNEDVKLYVKNPDIDFTRKRKLNFKEMIQLLLTMGGKSLNIELMEYFSYDIELPTKAAFIQQREKISPKAFEEVFNKFTQNSLIPKTCKGYRLLAIDGSSLCISRNPNDNKTYIQNGENSKGYNLLHLNALYDLNSRVYLDAIIQCKREMNEQKAFCDMIDRTTTNEKTIIIADRGYESYNLLEHVNQRNWNYVIRVKDINSNGMVSSFALPNEDSFDVNIELC